MTETRRLAAILAVDVVGYSRLMGEDEAGTAKAVRENREAVVPIVREFGGRLEDDRRWGVPSVAPQSNALSRSRCLRACRFRKLYSSVSMV
jgi:class 3 adenylate cyclase